MGKIKNHGALGLVKWKRPGKTLETKFETKFALEKPWEKKTNFQSFAILVSFYHGFTNVTSGSTLSTLYLFEFTRGFRQDRLERIHHRLSSYRLFAQRF